MFKIKWFSKNSPIITGLSSYSTEEAAQIQISIWEKYFNNIYYVEKIN